jgi:2-phospho-L-lactate guanylyltransferase
MRIWAIMPVKPFVRAKSRLAAVLSAEQRQVLAERTFRYGLGVLAATPAIAGTLVISRDPKVLSIAREYNAHTVLEGHATDLNSALMRAAEAVRGQGADGVLIIPADMPLYTSEDVAAIVEQGRGFRTVVITPDRADNGTNGLLTIPPGLIPFSFGPNSFQSHQAAATAAGVTLHIYRSERMGLDIDTPDDLALYVRLSGEESWQATPVVE